MSWLNMADNVHHQKNAVAVGCKISIEKDGYIATGVVSYIEGDIIEIELPQSKQYKPGDPVKLTAYSTNGFQTLHSSVVAKDIGMIIVLNPVENQRLAQRRNHPRIDVSESGKLIAVRWSKGGVNKLEEPLPISIRNFSLGGVGFVAARDPGIQPLMQAEALLDWNGGVSCTIEISRRQAVEDGLYIGARFVDIDAEHLQALRGFILRTQIKHRAKHRLDALTAM